MPDYEREKFAFLPEAHNDHFIITFDDSGHAVRIPPEAPPAVEETPPEAPKPGLFPCPCCGNLTLPYPPQNAVAFICPVCFWENDVFDPGENDPSDENGGMTLRQGRENYKRRGAVREDLVRHARAPLPGEIPPEIPDTIRSARESDFPAVYELVKTAFQTARVSDGTEQDFVVELRRREGFSLELVSERDGVLTGHVMLTQIDVPLPPGEEPRYWKFVMLAPLSVRLEDRNRGLGGALIREAAQRAPANAIFLVGDPDYYGRYGFVGAVEFGFENASGVPDRNLLVLPLDFTLRDRAGGAVNLH